MGHFSVEITDLPGSLLSGNQHPGYSLKSQDRFEEAGSEIRNPTIEMQQFVQIHCSQLIYVRLFEIYHVCIFSIFFEFFTIFIPH